LKLTWFACASILIETESARLLFDPFVPLDGAEHAVAAEDFGRDNSIFITHGHYDHAGSAGLIAGNGGSRVYCTASPAVNLAACLADRRGLTVVRPGDRFELSGVSVTAHPGRHITYDGRLIRRTVFSARNLRYGKNMRLLLGGRRRFRENGETVVYEIGAAGKTAVVFGSMAMADGHKYPREPDIAVLPYQGSSDLITPARRIIDALGPIAVLLDHFDDAFPPLSRTIDTASFMETMDRLYPGMRVIKPTARQYIDV
jgi:L-ascorbate metabolism protein UlaG (beta-lactamase superfamily)